LNKLQTMAMEKRIVQAKKQNNAKRFTKNYQDAYEIGLLFYIKNETQYDAMNDFYRSLRAEGKKVEALTFFTLKNDSPYNFPYHFITEEDIGWDGKIKSEKAHSFIEKPFDYLYTVSLDTMLLFDYILAKSKARCRIGSYYDEARTDFFELMVTGEGIETEGQLIEKMKGITQAIQKN